jgi:hypothetical protein
MKFGHGPAQATPALAGSLCGIDAVALSANVTRRLTIDGAGAALEHASDGAHA